VEGGGGGKKDLEIVEAGENESVGMGIIEEDNGTALEAGIRGHEVDYIRTKGFLCMTVVKSSTIVNTYISQRGGVGAVKREKEEEGEVKGDERNTDGPRRGN